MRLRRSDRTPTRSRCWRAGRACFRCCRLRLAAPTLSVDLGRIDELRGVSDDGDAIVIGAMTTHARSRPDPLVAEHAAVLAKTARTVADPQVRHRGTLGGALVHADPAGDLPAPILALDAELVVAGAGGERTVAAADFFVDLFTTAVGEDEILTKIRIPKHTGWGSHYEKFNRVAQQWSIVGVAATVRSRRRHDRRGEDRADQHGLDRRCVRPPSRRRWSVSPPRRTRCAQRPRRLRMAPTRRPTPTATPTIVGIWRRC